MVVAELHAGDIFGERSFLLSEPARASVVAESDSVSVLALSTGHLAKLFHAKGSQQIPAKFFYFLALDQAARLQRTSEQADEAARTVVATSGSSDALTSLPELVGNPAYLSIFQKYIGQTEHARAYASHLEFLIEILELHTCAEAQTTSMARHIFGRYLKEDKAAKGAGVARLKMVPQKVRKAAEAVLRTAKVLGSEHEEKNESFQRAHSSELRTAFDEAAALVSSALEASCMADFVTSDHYRYILASRCASARCPPSSTSSRCARSPKASSAPLRRSSSATAASRTS